MKKHLLGLFFALSSFSLAAQSLTYYLPEIDYDPDIPSPEEVLGFPIGAQHLSHDQLYYYLRRLAEASDRVVLTEYARTYENRPLVYLTITAPAHHARLEAIRQQHLALSDPEQSGGVDLAEQPVVLYQGYSVHGNEASGGNAALLVAYYLAAGQSEEVERVLREAVVLLDPCLNPDGFHRFSTWVNMHKNEHLTADPQDREFDEPWPGGRTNHYWFDLNRDWLLAQHPESRGRLELFHRWMPNVLTDHHEMGTNSTFFFMPGIPSRTHPLTPPENQGLTAELARYHAQALDGIGSLYYTQESFDDFYYGKGSTYPDVNGAVGILFEQASARGHVQESRNGKLTFPFAIRNQVRTSLSTQRGAMELREKLLAYQRDFYRDNLAEARKRDVQAYVFGTDGDVSRSGHLIDILLRHRIEVYRLAKDVKATGQDFTAGSAYVVPGAQRQSQLVEALFDTLTVFQDSLFYDVSSWTLPLAFNLPYATLGKTDFQRKLLGEAVQEVPRDPLPEGIPAADYAYVLPWQDYEAPALLAPILKAGLKARVAEQAFVVEGRRYERGTVVIPVQQEGHGPLEVADKMQALHRAHPGLLRVAGTGYTTEGIDLGSPSFNNLRAPKLALLVGDGVSAYEAGEAWHLLDQRYGMPVTKLDVNSVGRADLSRYQTLVMVSGSYYRLGKGEAAKLKRWVQGGGTLIAFKRAARWLARNGIGYVGIRKSEPREQGKGPKPYRRLGSDRGAQIIGGAIVDARGDLSHPPLHAYTREHIPLFRRGTLFFEPTANAYAMPLQYTSSPLLSGYVHPDQQERMKNAAAVVVTGTGRGKIICFADNPNFRAFWYGTNKLFANAVFFGHTIDNRARETAPKHKQVED